MPHTIQGSNKGVVNVSIDIGNVNLTGDKTIQPSHGSLQTSAPSFLLRPLQLQHREDLVRVSSMN